jgi:dolichol-phosphate mannosyltransferase
MLPSIFFGHSLFQNTHYFFHGINKAKFIIIHTNNRFIKPIRFKKFLFFKRFNNFYSAFLNVSYFPLRLFSTIGAIVALSGFLYALNIVYTYFVHKTAFNGWAPIMITTLVIGGLIMLMLGILGEYIWRILDEVKGRPNYIIDKKWD